MQPPPVLDMSPNEPDEGAGLKDLINILRRRRRTVVYTILAVTGLVAVIANSMTPYYTATSAVVIDPRESGGRRPGRA